MVAIVPRSTWGARPWAETPHEVAPTAREYFVIHYDGGSPITTTGPDVPRRIDAEHHAKGWSGIGYSFVVDQAGTVYEGRGWTLVGAHCPGRNRDGIGVQVAVGGDQQPTPAALASARALYDEACRRTGKTLRKTWHGANYATACPGPRLIAWVKAGMPTTQTTTTPEDDMQLSELAGWDVSTLVGLPAKSLNFQTLIARVYAATVQHPMDPAALAVAIAKHLPAASGVDPHKLAADVAADLAARLTT